jgi:DNA repair protein RadC
MKAKRSRASDVAVAYQPGSRVPAADRRQQIKCASDVYEAMADLRGADREHFVAFDLDARHRVISRRVVHIGTLNGVEVHAREVFRPAIVNGAAAILVSHGHPSGDPTPSQQDIEITRRLREVGELVGIAVLDHVVVVEGGFISLRERGGWERC